MPSYKTFAQHQDRPQRRQTMSCFNRPSKVSGIPTKLCFPLGVSDALQPVFKRLCEKPIVIGEHVRLYCICAMRQPLALTKQAAL